MPQQSDQSQTSDAPSRQTDQSKLPKASRLSPLARLLSWPILFYRYGISPVIPSRCRHFPTCSEYALEALETHGPFKGLWLSVKRIGRCHPWGTHGYDPVPEKELPKKS